MPRYYFHVRDGKDFRDMQGTELPNLAEARVEALRFTGALLGEADNQFWDGAEWTMTVTDDEHLTLFELNFAATNAPVLRNSEPTKNQDPAP